MSMQPSSAAEQFVENLDRRIGRLLGRIEQCDAYCLLAERHGDAQAGIALLKFILLEVFSYGPHIVEATFIAIGRMPKNRPDLMRPMLLHNLEETDHSEMALADYVRLGGNEAFARSRRPTPASFVVGATCRMLAERENPFAYLGYMYLLEALTPILTERAQGFLAVRQIPTESRQFIDFHAKEDIGHACQLRKLIVRVGTEFPESMAAIEYAFDCFTSVYPLPVWQAALNHVREEIDNAHPALR